jgi:hypothetical protein
MNRNAWPKALADWLQDEYHPWLVKFTAAFNQLEQQVADLSGQKSSGEGDPVPDPPPPPPYGDD